MLPCHTFSKEWAAGRAARAAVINALTFGDICRLDR